MKDGKDRFGINIMKYMTEHEKYVKEALKKERDPKALLEYHDMKLRWAQHERLVHLIVTALFAALLGLLFCMQFFVEFGLPGYVLLMIILILTAAYVTHYFRLENRVQHWYRVADEIRKRMDGGD